MGKPRATLCVDCGSPAIQADHTDSKARCRCRPCYLKRCRLARSKRSPGAIERERERDQRRSNRPSRHWTRPCPNCGVSFTDNRGRTYCGGGCKHIASIRPPKPLKPKPVRTRCCEFCGVTILSPAGAQRFCDVWCQEASNGRRVLECPVRCGECRYCGKVYCAPQSVRDGFCSASCSGRQARKDRKAAVRAHRQAGQSFTLREVAERDGWRCHLCGLAVPNRAYKARDHDPTIDHLIPVSKGGAHTFDNVALAHNRCNWERGNADVSFQLRLVG